MKEYRGSIKKRSDVNWSCLSLLVHFDGPIVLKVHVEADNLLRQKFYRQLQPKCFHQVHCNLINDFKIHVRMRQGIILYEYDFLWSTPLASHTTLKTDNYGLTIWVSLAYKLELENNDSPFVDSESSQHS